jgi:hypothetical protein
MAANRDWDRLAEFTRERRVELGMTQEDVRFAGGPSTATMRLIEGALQQSYQPATLRDLEKALQWERGSVIRVLSGGEPSVVTPASAPVAPSLLPASAAMEEAMRSHLQELEWRVEFAHRKHPGETLIGEHVFPLDPQSAASWDYLLTAGWDEATIIRGLAAMTARREQLAQLRENDGSESRRRART